MNDKSNNNKIKNANNIIPEHPQIYKPNFSTESETISRFIIEKLISFSITEYIKNKVNKILPEYCFNQIFQSLDIVTHLDFISYDKDDFPFKPKNFLKKMKSSKNLNKRIKLDLPNELEEIYNSEIIRNYRFDKEYDPNVQNSLDIDFSKLETSRKEDNTENKHEKILNFLIRETYNDIDTNNSFQKAEIKKEEDIKKFNKKTNYNFREDKNNIIKEIYSNNNIISQEKEKEVEPFNISPDEKIEEIKNIESHKFNINLNSEQNIYFNNKKSKFIPFEKVVESTNFWNSILQPISAPIDRDAGTKIKFEKPAVLLKINKKMLSKTIPDEKIIVSEEPKIKNDENVNNENQKKKIKRINFDNPFSNNQNRNKKKKVIELPFESTDIEPKNLETYKELDEIAFLRESVEKDIQEKKKEKELLAKIEKEKKLKLDAVEEMRKELYKKNVTVDAKGEIVYIKQIDINRLIEEFNKGKTNFKNIKILETKPKYLKNNEIKIEKNPDDLKDDLKEEKSKKRKKKLGFFLPKSSISNENNIRDNTKKKSFKDKGPKYASGSNFAIINPEIGVDIIENEKKKSGGKDYYKKYNRFSIEVFQEQLSKTSNSFFPKASEIKDINFHTNETNKTDRILADKKIEKIMEYKSKTKSINNNKTLSKNSNEKNSLSLKIKNLKIALQDLDLVKDGAMNNLNKIKKFKKSFILTKILNTNKINRNNLSDMNKFAKTLVGKENWGAGIYTERKNNLDYKIPKKPETIELKRELPLNMMKHMPRKRLPPINTSIKLNTLEGFFTDKQSKKRKEIKSVDKENKVK